MNVRTTMMGLAVSAPGWLDKLTGWFKDTIGKAWHALSDMFNDLIVTALESVLHLGLKIIEALPVPDFITNTSICGLLSNAGPTAAWVVGTFKVAECFAVFTAAVAFRLLRKLLTLGQW